MTHDTGNIPPVPSNVPEAAKQPRPTAPDGGADRGTRETRTASAGAPGTAGSPRPDSTPDAKPRTKTPASASAPLNGEGTADAADRSAAHTLRPLFPEADHDKLALRIQHAVSEFVESPAARSRKPRARSTPSSRVSRTHLRSTGARSEPSDGTVIPVCGPRSCGSRCSTTGTSPSGCCACEARSRPRARGRGDFPAGRPSLPALT